MNMVPIVLNNATDLTNIIGQVTPVLTMVTNILSQLLANEIFQFFFACGFVKIGLGLFKRAKRIGK